jgi:hypothetical protein
MLIEKGDISWENYAWIQLAQDRDRKGTFRYNKSQEFLDSV